MASRVLIVMGSESDRPMMQAAFDALMEFGIESFMTVASAHRSPSRATKLAAEAEEKGFEVIIAGAGMAAHLAGVLAAHTTLPVIGVPIDSSALKGLDSLLSTVQMPSGVPVASMAIGKAGARNAGIFAAQIIGRKDEKVGDLLKEFKKKMAADVEQKAGAMEAGL
jgi:phosphoribosylaminoimidazole carboxylase PurE protein